MNTKLRALSAVLGASSFLLLPSLRAESSTSNSSSSTSTANHAADADNSARNQRDRDNANPTPLNQGKSESDVATTQQIRKMVVSDKALSVSAHNVKIITSNGHVTLRGPVKNAEEKQLIGEIANKVATPANVDNQLEVKAATGSDSGM